MTSAFLRRVAWLPMAAIAFAGLPLAWSTTLVRWLQFGSAASWKWPAAAVGLAVMGGLLCHWMHASSWRPLGRRDLIFLTATWCAAHGVCWRWRVSPLGDDPLVMLAYLASTTWLGWCGAMFCVPHTWSARLKVLAVLLLPQTAWLAAVEAHGADGAGRPLVAWRMSVAARAATQNNRVTRAAMHPPATTVGFTPRPTTRAGATSDRRSGGAVRCDYPRFRGSDGLATVEQVRLARDWLATPPRLLWRRNIGGGWSGFAISGTRGVTQEQRGDQEAVVCYELASGHECWAHLDAVCFRGAMGGDGPRATPAIADGDVYAIGATGILNCLDAATGLRRWSVDVLADNDASNLFHGLSGSPLVVDRAVIVSAGGPRGHSLVAYDRRTGKRLFHVGNDPAGYSSPLLCRIGGQRQILVFNRPGLAAHDPKTGELLWTFPWPNDQETNCSQPVPVDHDRVLVSTGYGKGSAMVAVRFVQGKWSTETLWTSRGLKCKFSSPVVRGGIVYGLDDGVLACLDLADGRRRWRAGRYGHGQLLLIGDVLLIQAESGEVALVAATPKKHRELGRFAALDGKTWNYPALAGPLLVVRNDHEAACYELPVEEKRLP